MRGGRSSGRGTGRGGRRLKTRTARPKDGTLLGVARGTDREGNRRAVTAYKAGRGFKLFNDRGHSMVGHPQSQSREAIVHEIGIIYELDDIVFDYPQCGVGRER